VHATQFFEFAASLADLPAEGSTVRVALRQLAATRTPLRDEVSDPAVTAS
jgi:hypothetical protein